MKTALIAGLGSLAFFGLCWFAVTNGSVAIEAKIADDATAALSDSRFADVSVESNGRSVTLVGQVATGAERVYAEQSVRNLPGVKRVINRLELSASESIRRRSAAPYQLIVSFSDSEAIFSGLVASEQSRSSLRAIAEERYGAVSLVDDLRVEPNVRREWQDAAGEILSPLIVFPKVHVELTDTEVLVTGQALTTTDRESAAEQIRAALPYGVAFQYDVRVPGE